MAQDLFRVVVSNHVYFNSHQIMGKFLMNFHASSVQSIETGYAYQMRFSDSLVTIRIRVIKQDN